MEAGIWLELTVVTAPEAVEAVSAFLESLGARGVWIDEPGLYQRKKPTDWDYLGTTAPTETTVRGYFLPEEARELRPKVENMLQELARLPLEIGPGRVLLREVAEEEWATAWKAYFKPLKLGRIVIIPSWEEYSLAPGEIPIRLDPGMAFGTGTHPTTALCLLALQEILGQDEVTAFLPIATGPATGSDRPLVIDVGTGSGILAIAAARLAPVAVLGLDTDAGALRVAAENVDRNGLADRIELRPGTLEAAGPRAQVIVANIIADTILELAPVVKRRLCPDGIFLASGIIEEREDEVSGQLLAQGWDILDIRRQEGWLALLARPKG